MLGLEEAMTAVVTPSWLHNKEHNSSMETAIPQPQSAVVAVTALLVMLIMVCYKLNNISILLERIALNVLPDQKLK